MKLKNKKLKTLLFVFLLSTFYFLFSVFNVSAVELRYFESLYDTVGNLTLATAGPSYQYFVPYDDYVSGFDIWIENEGSAGTASFGLRDINDNLLAAKTINIPTIPRTFGGEKFHVAFDQPIYVTSGQIYKIKMLSSMPKLKIYYSNLVDIQIHNATNNIEGQIKPAYIGANEQSFFFKFALYEDADISSPIISNFSVNAVSPEKASFRFNANEPVDYKVIYWVAGSNNIEEKNFLGGFSSCNEGINNCFLEINTLPNSEYNYRLTVKDVWKNEVNIEGNFTSSPNWVSSTATSTSTSTQPIAENNQPLIISNSQIVSLTARSIKIAWSTNRAANSSLLISLNAPGGQTVISIGDAAFELDHVLNSGEILRPGIKYIAEIASLDSNNRYASQFIEFQTLNEPVLPPNNQNQNESQINQDNQNQNNQQQNQEQINQQEKSGSVSNQNNLSGSVGENKQGDYYFNIAWNDNNYAGAKGGYRIDIFDSNKNLVKRVLVSSEKRNAVVEGLLSGDYYAIVYANNGNGVFEKVAPPENFVIPTAKGKISEQIKKIKKYFSGFPLYVGLFSFLAIAGIIIFYVIKKRKI